MTLPIAALLTRVAVAAVCALGMVPGVLPARAAAAAPGAVPLAADPTLAAAGDIVGECRGGTCGDQQTADVIGSLNPTAVLALGDISNLEASVSDYTVRFARSWGAFTSRIRPVPGNHDYLVPGAVNYYDYFGAAAHPPRGYYSFDLGSWHVVAINSNCSRVGGCQAGSAEETWLRKDLAAHRAACTLAYWHHPRYSSSLVGGISAVKPLFQDLVDARADILLSGHSHEYERFAPQDNAGRLDPGGGVRQFVVGTGGAQHAPRFGPIAPNSQVRNNTAFGALYLTLGPGSYRWKFVPVAGKTFTDSGSTACHHAGR